MTYHVVTVTFSLTPCQAGIEEKGSQGPMPSPLVHSIIWY